MRTEWWRELVRCPNCGNDPGGGPQCACGRAFSVSANVLEWATVSNRAGHAEPRRRNLGALIDPLRTPVLPFRYITKWRLEQYYERTLTDRRLAEKWAGHYLRGLSLPSGATILDFGCGRGRNIGLLNQLGHRTVGQDLTRKAWWSRLPDSGFQTGADASTLPWREASFDAVVEVGVIHYLHAETAAAHAREVRRVLKPGGVWVLLEANSGSANAGYVRRQIGQLHDLSTVRRWATDAGLVELGVSYEGYHAPVLPAYVDFLRKQAVPGPMDLADFDSSLAARVTPEQRALWLLRLKKS